MSVAVMSASGERPNVTTRARVREAMRRTLGSSAENGDTASWQIFDESALLLRRRLQAPKIPVVIAADIGHDTDLWFEDSRLGSDLPRPVSRDLLNAEAGAKPDRQDIACHVGRAIFVPGSALPGSFQHCADQPRRGGFGATACDADIGNVAQDRAI